MCGVVSSATRNKRAHVSLFEIVLGIEQPCRCYGPLKAMPTSTGGIVVALQRQPLPFF